MATTQLRAAAAATTLLAVIGTSAVAAGSAAAEATATETVNCNSGNLQTALDDVSSGGTVKVTGTCVGNFSITKSVTVEGAPSAILDGANSGRVLVIGTSLSVRLSHLAVEDGNFGGGAGIFLGDSAHLRLTHVTVAHNDSYSGGGGLATDDNTVVTVISSTFSFNSSALADNTPVNLGGGAIDSAGRLTIDHSTFTHNSVKAMSENSSAHGGAIDANGPLDITDSTFAHNLVQGTDAEGGSIDITGSSTKVVKSTFTDDTADGVDPNARQTAAGGSIISDSTTTSLSGVHITGSRASVDGPFGGQASGGGALLISRGKITGSVFQKDSTVATTTGSNSQTLSQGGGILVEPNASTAIRRTTLEGNTASATSTQGYAYGQGGGVFAFGRLSLAASTISHNTTNASSGVLANSNGGGAMVSSQVHPTTLTNSTVAKNTSHATLSQGAASTATATATGGGLQDESEEMTFRYTPSRGTRLTERPAVKAAEWTSPPACRCRNRQPSAVSGRVTKPIQVHSVGADSSHRVGTCSAVCVAARRARNTRTSAAGTPTLGHSPPTVARPRRSR